MKESSCPGVNVFAELISQALYVLDRFHIVRNTNLAIDEVRRQEVIQHIPQPLPPLLCLHLIRQPAYEKPLWRLDEQGQRARLSAPSRRAVVRAHTTASANAP